MCTSMLLLLLTNILTPLIILSSFNEKPGYRNTFYGLILLMQFGLIGVFTSLDGLLFYIFWELSLIPVFLIFLWFGAKGKRRALMKFFIYMMRFLQLNMQFIGSLTPYI